MTSQIRAECASRETEATRTSDAFVTLATTQAQRSYRLAGLILRDAVEAQDAMQEALLRAWQAWPKLR
jgi:DNA-directed RNA polymerase specialized sigma24 family protein